MPHLTARTARTFTTHGVTFTSFAGSATGAESLGAWRADFAPRTPGLAHTMSEEEVLHVLTGTLDIELAEDSFTVVAGEAVIVPAGERFRVSNETDEPAQAWVVTPLGMTATLETGEAMTPPWAQ
ncbi:cupin domain-containing protein [Brevibacterium ammoniilyticum]|uniref:Cupin domain-containing protein n=1 Tax=Brevibacterium ammoniilyticum TaxID=1046555 RepID=A0ABP9U556_9MICO